MSIQQDQVSANVNPKAYQYKPIDPNKQIRIVELPPGNLHDPIELKITEENLNATYDALSYTWGDHNNRVSISVKVDNSNDTKKINVTRNLSMALRHIRDNHGRTRYLWIDALCINQKDSAEKTHQVAMMTQIYKKAHQVIIWLGPQANGSDLAMKTLGRRGDKKLGRDLMRKKNSRIRRALEELPRREYWTRVWVVQEIFMARAITIHCGQFQVDWDSIENVLPEFLEARTGLLNRNMLQERVQNAVLKKKPSEGTRDMKTEPIQNVIRLAKDRSAKIRRGSWWLFNILLEHRHYGATDERDKIFSMLGLLDQSPSQNSGQPVSTRLYVDYDLSFLDVSIRLFNYLALYPPKREASKDNEKRLLNVVCASQPKTNPDFPTWLPDFSRDNGMKPWPLGKKSERPVYFAAHAKLSYDSRTLSIQGAKIGTITAVTDDQDDCQATDDLSLLARLGHFLRLMRVISFDGAGPFWKSLVLGDKTGETLVDTLTMEPPVTNSQILEDFEAVVKNGSDRSSDKFILPDMAEYPEILRGFLDTFRSKSYRRRSAIFERSREHNGPEDEKKRLIMAMVPEDAKEGDNLFQLGSCEYWVLLRPIVTEIPCFHFVGPVYLAETPSWLKGNANTPRWISLH